MANVVLRNINKIYDNGFHAVHDFSFDISDKEFVVFVGPSGCGKSTTLRMIAGLENISDGELYVDGILFNNVSPQDRDVAMVFQNYALYPHMSVYENMAFGLKNHKIKKPKLNENGEQEKLVDKKTIKYLEKQIKIASKSLKKKNLTDDERSFLEKEKKEYEEKISLVKTNPVPAYVYVKYPKEEIDSRIRKAAKILDIEQFLNQKPKSLSGGQQQRVALGRAIVRNPKLFLMDEPLSNLDAKLRVAMRSEIVDLHEKIGATTIYVTHDQTEAMTMADKIIVMNKGYIQQIGKPEEIYRHPANRFVATFIGSPAMNLFKATYSLKEGNIDIGETKIKLSKGKQEAVKAKLAEIIKRYEQDSLTIESNIADYCAKNNLKARSEKKKIDVANRIASDEVLNKRKAYLFSLKDEVDKGTIALTLGIRPEDILIGESGQKIKTTIVELLGAQLIVHGLLDETHIAITSPANTNIKSHDTAYITFNEDNIHLFLTDDNETSLI